MAVVHQKAIPQELLKCTQPHTSTASPTFQEMPASSLGMVNWVDVVSRYTLSTDHITLYLHVFNGFAIVIAFICNVSRLLFAIGIAFIHGVS